MNEGRAIVDSSWELVGEVCVPGKGGGDGVDKCDDDASAAPARVMNLTFPGLFAVNDELPENCFTPDGGHIICSTRWGSVLRVVAISTRDGTVRPLDFDLLSSSSSSSSYDDKDPLRTRPGPRLRPDAFPSQELLCLDEDGGMTVIQSEPNHPPILGYLPPQEEEENGGPPGRGRGRGSERRGRGDGGVRRSHLVFKFPPLAASSLSVMSSRLYAGRGFTYHVLNVRPSHGGTAGGVPVQCVLLLPARSGGGGEGDEDGAGTGTGGGVPMIAIPDGGGTRDDYDDVVAHTTAYSPPHAYLSGGGRYAVLLVNRRGSTGFGRSSHRESLSSSSVSGSGSGSGSGSSSSSTTGNVVDVDVAFDRDVRDVVHAVRYISDRLGGRVIDRDRVGIYGDDLEQVGVTGRAVSR